MVKYAFESSNKLFTFSYLWSLIKQYWTMSSYFLNKVNCYMFWFLKTNIEISTTGGEVI